MIRLFLLLRLFLVNGWCEVNRNIFCVLRCCVIYWNSCFLLGYS